MLRCHNPRCERLEPLLRGPPRKMPVLRHRDRLKLPVRKATNIVKNLELHLFDPRFRKPAHPQASVEEKDRSRTVRHVLDAKRHRQLMNLMQRQPANRIRDRIANGRRSKAALILERHVATEDVGSDSIHFVNQRIDPPQGRADVIVMHREVRQGQVLAAIQ